MARYSIRPYSGMSPSIMDDFFNQSLERFFGHAPAKANGSDGQTTLPAVNVVEQDERFEVHVAAPGMQRDDFSVDVEDGILRISAETTSESSNGSDDAGYHRREFSYSSFERRFSLPDNVDEDGIQASYTDGILRLELPKVEPEAPEARTRRIEIA